MPQNASSMTFGSVARLACAALCAATLAGCGGEAPGADAPRTDVDVSIEPPSATVPTSARAVFEAIVTGIADTSVTWSVEPGACGAVTQGGQYTAPGAAGFCTVRATSNANPTVSGTAAVTVTPAAGTGTTWNVGPGRTYRTLNAVQAVVRPGDTVLVDGDATYGAATLSVAGTAQAPITYRGVRVNGNRPRLAASGSSTSVLSGNASHVVVEGFELSGSDGGADNSPNRAGRCYRHQANDVVLRDVYLHHCLQGILGTDQGSGSLTAEYVEVAYCGNGIGQHGIYMATDEVAYPGSVFRLRHSYVHNGQGGNAARSRAERNELYYNWIEGGIGSTPGTDTTYREWESLGPDPQGAPAGWSDGLVREDSDFVGNVFWKRSAGSSAILRLGGDGTGRTFGRKRIVGNTFIMGTGTGASGVINVFENIDSVELHNNVFYRQDGAALTVLNDTATWVSGRAVSGTNNWVPTGSAAPAEWTGTITGASPAFTNLAGYDLTPTSASPLRDAGGPATASPVGHPFPNPLPVPLYVPPRRTVTTTPVARASNGAIDVGAYELAGP